MLETVLRTHDFNLFYARKLVDGIDESTRADQFAGLTNHPAWILGHLTTTAGLGTSLLGITLDHPEVYKELFMPGKKPVSDPSVYPQLSELIERLAAAHQILAKAVSEADPGVLSRPLPVQGLAKAFPTIGDGLTFVMTSHEAVHLGQLSAWRRAKGLPSALSM